MSQEVQSENDSAAEFYTLQEMRQNIGAFIAADLEGLFAKFEAGEDDEV